MIRDKEVYPKIEWTGDNSHLQVTTRCKGHHISGKSGKETERVNVLRTIDATGSGRKRLGGRYWVTEVCSTNVRWKK